MQKRLDELWEMQKLILKRQMCIRDRITGSKEQWTAFLTTSARLYKYPFAEQLMIYKQRPEATACAEYDLWNDRMNRYVKRGSKGIAPVSYTHL